MAHSFFERTFDPIADAIEYYGREDTRPVVGRCVVCDDPIRGEDSIWHGDDYYEFDDDLVCDYCVLKYIERFRR